MSGLRCWPGALAMIQAPHTAAGMTVQCVRLYTGGFINGDRIIDVPGWFIDRLVPACGGALKTNAVADKLLVPLTPPPESDATDDRAPCDSPVELVGV